MPEYKVLPLSSISAPEQPLRLALESEGLDELVRSIRSVGLLQPLVVVARPHGYEVKAGHRRLLACRMAPLPMVPAMVVEGDAEFQATVMVTENVIRQDLTPVEEANALRQMRDVLGLDVAACARKTGKSESWVRGRLALLDWPLVALEAVAAGRASVAALRPLVELEDEQERARLIRCAVEGGATEVVTRSWAASYRGEAAAGVDGESQRSQSAMPLVDVTVHMPCFLCDVKVPAIDLRILRVCDPCIDALPAAMQAYVRELRVAAGDGGA